MLVANINNSLMGCSALGSTEGEIAYPEGVPSGVLSGHAYSVIDCFEIDVELIDDDGKNFKTREKLVRCRNPWGKFLNVFVIFIRKERMEWCLVRWF